MFKLSKFIMLSSGLTLRTYVLNDKNSAQPLLDKRAKGWVAWVANVSTGLVFGNLHTPGSLVRNYPISLIEDTETQPPSVHR